MLTSAVESSTTLLSLWLKVKFTQGFAVLAADEFVPEAYCQRFRTRETSGVQTHVECGQSQSLFSLSGVEH